MSQIMEGIENKHLKHYLDNTGNGYNNNSNSNNSNNNSGVGGDNEDEALLHRQKRKKSYVGDDGRNSIDVILPIISANEQQNHHSQSSSLPLPTTTTTTTTTTSNSSSTQSNNQSSPLPPPPTQQQLLPDNQILINITTDNNSKKEISTNKEALIPSPTINNHSNNHDHHHQKPTPTSNNAISSSPLQQQQQTNSPSLNGNEEDILGNIENINQNNMPKSVVQKLVDLTFDYIVKNIHRIDTLKKLPERYAHPLLRILLRNKELNRRTWDLFKDCELVKLNLSANPNLDDDWLDFTGRMAESITSVVLSKNGKLTNLGITRLGVLKTLTHLDISYCENVTCDGLEQLINQKIPLVSLSLESVKFDMEKCLNLLKSLPALRSLNIASNNLTDLQCRSLKNLHALKHLSVSGNPDLTDEFFNYLTSCPLVELNLSYNEKISEQGLKILIEQSESPIQTSLTSLSLNNCAVHDEMMGQIGKFSNLKNLSLINNPFSDAGSKHLSKLQSLTSLDLSMCTEMTNATLESLQDLNQISRLNLNFNPQLSTEGISKFLNLSHLTSLGIIGCDGLLIKVKHRPLVLLVEDNPFQVKLITRIFTRHNFEVEVASNGRMAVEMYKNANYKYELILMDIIMPIMDGLTATMLLRDFERENGLRRIPVIIQTADMERHRKVCLAAGCDDFLLKPLDRKVIERAREFLAPKSN